MYAYEQKKSFWAGQSITILSVFIGGILAFGTSYLLQAQLFHQETSRDAKKERTKVYLDYLEKANAYNSSSSNLKLCITANNTVKPAIDNWRALCQAEIRQDQQERFNFQVALNQLFIYGSDEAVKKAVALATPLPPSGGGFTIDNPLVFDKITNFDSTAINMPYQEFNALACKELPATPRKTCTSV